MNQSKTELCDFLQRLRGSKTQTAFQEELDKLMPAGNPLPANYVSLVERGARQTLLPRFLEALERISNRSGSDLELMNRQMSASSRSALNLTPPLNIVTGHTAWASALIGAFFSPASESSKNLRLATCCAKRKIPDSDDEGEIQPDGQNAKFIEMGSQWVKNLGDLESFADPTNFYHFTAADARDALDAGWADVIAVPSAVIGRNEAQYRSVARLVVSSSGCVMITREALGKQILGQECWDQIEKAWRENRDGKEWSKITETWEIDGAALATKLSQSTRQNGESKDAETKETAARTSLRIGAETSTLGQTQIKEMCSFAGLDSQEAEEVSVPISIRYASNQDLGSIDDLRESEKSPKLDAALLWMPQAAWILDKIAKKQGKPHAAISLGRCPVDKHHPIPLFEFSLVTTRDKAEDRESMLAIKGLLKLIAKAAGQISNFRDGLQSPLVNALGVYFGVVKPDTLVEDRPLARARLQRVLGSMAYEVSIPLESLDLFN